MMLLKLIRFWLLCGLAFALPAIAIAFLIRPIDSAFLISAICLLAVLGGPFALVLSSVVDLAFDLVAMSAIVGGIIMVVPFGVLARRKVSAPILKAHIVVR